MSTATSTGISRVRVVDPRSDPRWDPFVLAAPHGSVHHTAGWFAVVQRAQEYRPAALVCEDDAGRLTGVLPMVEKHGLLGGRRLTSLPHTPCAGPLASSDKALTALLRGAVDLACERGCWLQLKSAHGEMALLQTDLVRTSWEDTYVLDLPPGGAGAFRFGDARNHGRLRWAVNKAARSGVEVREAASSADLRDWYSLYLETMRWHAVPPRPLRFFRAVWELLGPVGRARLLLAEQRTAGGTRLLAGSWFLVSHGTVSYAFNGRRRDALSYRPNDALHWRAISDACEAGLRHYDFGEVDAANRGLADFKTKWGATPRPRYRYHFPASREPEAGVLRPDGVVRRAAERAWRRVPLRATAATGAWIYGRL